jgi:hypothetical protein
LCSTRPSIHNDYSCTDCWTSTWLLYFFYSFVSKPGAQYNSKIDCISIVNEDNSILSFSLSIYRLFFLIIKYKWRKDWDAACPFNEIVTRYLSFVISLIHSSYFFSDRFEWLISPHNSIGFNYVKNEHFFFLFYQ